MPNPDNHWALADEFFLRHKWGGLVATFAAFLVVFSLAMVDLVHQIRDERHYRFDTVWLGIAIAAAIAAVLTAVAFWTRARASSAAARRLGLAAWYEGRLQSAEPERTLAIKDLRRRERALTSGVPPVAFTMIWVVVAGLQIVVSDSALHTAAWILIGLFFVGFGIYGVVQRRHLYQLQELLAETDPVEAG